MKAPLALVSISLLLAPLAAVAQEEATSAFPDVPAEHASSEAVEWAFAEGIFKGMPDGLFHPEQTVDRATALTLLIRLSEKEPATPEGESVYSDVAADAWYRGSVETALENGIIDGPPTKTALDPSRVVTREEFLKMLFVSQGETIPAPVYIKEMSLSFDTDFDGLWSMGYLRKAFSRGIINVSDKGWLEPTLPLTRGEIAILLFNNERSQKGEYVQTLVTQGEEEILRFFSFVERSKFIDAGFLVARLRLLSESGASADPQSPVVVGLGRTTSALSFVLAAQRAGVAKNMADVTGNAGKATAIAQELGEQAPFTDLAKRIIALAKAIETQAAAKVK